MADESVYMTRATQDLIKAATQLSSIRKACLAAASSSELRSRNEANLEDAVVEVAEAADRLQWILGIEETQGKKPKEEKIPKGG